MWTLNLYIITIEGVSRFDKKKNNNNKKVNRRRVTLFRIRWILIVARAVFEFEGGDSWTSFFFPNILSSTGF